MRYASIRDMDISNGEGVGVALFVQGCHFHCYNCFNPETWDFNGGKDWTDEKQSTFLELINRTYIRRVSILGGEPLADENIEDIANIIKRIRELTEWKNIWIYSGYTWDEIMHPVITDYCSPKRIEIVSMCDVIIDGKYIDGKRDITLKWRGSRNQRVIDVQKSLGCGEVVFWDK